MPTKDIHKVVTSCCAIVSVVLFVVSGVLRKNARTSCETIRVNILFVAHPQTNYHLCLAKLCLIVLCCRLFVLLLSILRYVIDRDSLDNPLLQT